ncbi:36159_t:CDS:2, partial [Racocetra persica]
TGGPWLFGSEFTVRIDLPKTDSITYTLNCPNTAPMRTWSVMFLVFTGNNESFYQDFCLNSGDRKRSVELSKAKIVHDV